MTGRHVVLAMLVALIAATAAVGAGSASAVPSSISVWEREWHVTLSTPSRPHGTITFYVTNYGQDPHDVAVRRGNVQYAKTARIPPGGHLTLTLRLKPGTYLVFCAIPGHRAAGMATTLRVT